MKQFTAEELESFAALLAAISHDSPESLPTAQRRRETCCETTWRLVLSAGQSAVEHPGTVILFILLAGALIPSVNASRSDKDAELDDASLLALSTEQSLEPWVIKLLAETVNNPENDLYIEDPEIYWGESLGSLTSYIEDYFLSDKEYSLKENKPIRLKSNMFGFFLEYYLAHGHEPSLVIADYLANKMSPRDLDEIVTLSHADLLQYRKSKEKYNMLRFGDDFSALKAVCEFFKKNNQLKSFGNFYLIFKKVFPWSENIKNYMLNHVDNSMKFKLAIKNAEENGINYQGFFESMPYIESKSNLLKFKETINNFYHLLEKPEELHILKMLYAINLSDVSEFKLLFDEYKRLYQKDLYVRNKGGRYVTSARYELFKAYIQHPYLFSGYEYFETLKSQGVLMERDDERHKEFGRIDDYLDQLDILKFYLGAMIKFKEYYPLDKQQHEISYQYLIDYLPEEELKALPYYSITGLKKFHLGSKKSFWNKIYALGATAAVIIGGATFFKRKIMSKPKSALHIKTISQRVLFSFFFMDEKTPVPMLFQAAKWNAHHLKELKLRGWMKSSIKEFIKIYFEKNYLEDCKLQKNIYFSVYLVAENINVVVDMVDRKGEKKRITIDLNNEELWRKIITRSKEHKKLCSQEQKKEVVMRRQNSLIGDLNQGLTYSETFDGQCKLINEILDAYHSNKAHQTKTLDKIMSRFRLYSSKNKSIATSLNTMLTKSKRDILSDAQYEDYSHQIKIDILPDLRNYTAELPGKLAALTQLLKGRYQNEPVSKLLLKVIDGKSDDTVTKKTHPEYKKFEHKWRKELEGLNVEMSTPDPKNSIVLEDLAPKTQINTPPPKDTSVEVIVHSSLALIPKPKKLKKPKKAKATRLSPNAFTICYNLRIQIRELASIIENEMVKTPEAISYHLIRILRQSCKLSENVKMKRLSNQLVHATQYVLAHSKRLDALNSLLNKISNNFIETANLKFGLADFDKKIDKKPKLKELISGKMRKFFKNELLVKKLVEKLQRDKNKVLVDSKDASIETSAFLQIIQSSLSKLTEFDAIDNTPGYQLFYANAIGEAWQSILKAHLGANKKSYTTVKNKLQKKLGLSDNALKCLEIFRSVKKEIGHYTQQDAMLLKRVPKSSLLKCLNKELHAMRESKPVVIAMAHRG